VVSTRVRLARNLVGHPFPDHADAQARSAVWKQAWEERGRLLGGVPVLACETPDLDPVVRQFLVERCVISRELTVRGKGSGVLVAPHPYVSVMVNEEDHFRIQALCPGLALNQTYGLCAAVDGALCRSMKVAFSGQLGFLTACLSNTGTGMRASVMLHLPGLGLLDRMDAVGRAVTEFGMTLRGGGGEGTEPVGYFYQISNQSTLGESEQEILLRLEMLVRRLVWQERNARLELVQESPTRLYDYVGRAYGILAYARRLTSHEALERLSALRLGAWLGLLPNVSVEQVDRWILEMQPAHLMLMKRDAADPEARDEIRAAFLRKALNARNSKTERNA